MTDILMEHPAEWKPVEALLQGAQARIQAAHGDASGSTIRSVLDDLATEDQYVELDGSGKNVRIRPLLLSPDGWID